MWNLTEDSKIQLTLMHIQSFFFVCVCAHEVFVVWSISSLLNIIWLFFYTVAQGVCITVAYPTKQMLMNLHIWVDLGDLNSVVWKICVLVLGQTLLLCWQLQPAILGIYWLLIFIYLKINWLIKNVEIITHWFDSVDKIWHLCVLKALAGMERESQSEL